MKTPEIYLDLLLICEGVMFIGAISLIGYRGFKRDLTPSEKLAIDFIISLLIVGSFINFAQISELLKCLSPQK